MKGINRYGTKHPLGVIYLAPYDLMERFGLNTEVLGKIDQSDPRLALAISVHAPWCLWKTGFYNVSDRDDCWRTKSIEAIEKSIRQSARHENICKVVMHPAPRMWYQWDQESEGDYDRMITAIQYLADIAAGCNLELCIENTSTIWAGVPDETPMDEADRSMIRRINFGSSPEEWRQIALDSDRPNISLCLDPSHAATFIQLEPDLRQRTEIADKYLANPEMISHVHWNDSDIRSNAGREDMHLSIGQGTFPAAFHKRIKELDATIILEHFSRAEGLEKELRYIESL